jgi:uncharacterized protein YraI
VISGTAPAFVSAELVVTRAPQPAAAQPPTGATTTVTTTASVTTALPTNSAAAVVSNTFVNLRGGPGIAYPLLGTLQQGVVLPVVGRSVDKLWWQVTASGGTAWVFGELVQVNALAQQAPTVQAPPPPVSPTPAATVAVVPIGPTAASATATPAAAAAVPAANDGLPPCNPENPWWGVKVHKDDGYTFCVPVQFEFVGSTAGDEIRMQWHIYGIERLEMRVDPDPNGCEGGAGTTGFKEFVVQKTDDFRLNRRSFKRGGYKIGLWAILPGGREQDWGQLNFCGVG